MSLIRSITTVRRKGYLRGGKVENGFFNKLFGKQQEEEMTMTKSNIGIILGSTRDGRVSPQVGAWVKN